MAILGIVDSRLPRVVGLFGLTVCGRLALLFIHWMKSLNSCNGYFLMTPR